MATFGASSSCVVAGSGPRPRSKNIPPVAPAALNAATVLGSLGKISEPAGMEPAEALTRGASATSPSIPLRSRSRTALSSPVPLRVGAYQSAAPSRTPP
jgi:hypothetical protein